MTDTKKIISEITFTLDTPIEYATKGNVEHGSFITLKAPTSRQMSECADLKQSFLRALPKDGGVEVSSSKSEDKTTLDDLDGETIMMMISMSQEVQLKTVLLIARELFCSGIAFLDGEIKMTKPLLDSMVPDEFESMVGEYLRNFILASWLEKMKAMME